jgi:osmoprotectant transport system permease protein
LIRRASSNLHPRDGIVVAGALGFENTYSLALRRERAKELRVARVGDLVDAAHGLSVGGDYELFDRPEWKRLLSPSRFGVFVCYPICFL